MVKLARPSDMERSVVMLPNISESGTLASTTLFIPRSPTFCTSPRFDARWPVTSPRNFSGVTTSTFMMGSRITGRARLQASCTACDPAILNALLNRRNKFLRNNSSFYGINKFKVVIALDILFNFRLRVKRLHRTNRESDMTILAAASRLTDVFRFGFSFALNGFAVSDLRLSNIGFHAKFTLQPVHHNFKLKFAHAHNHGLAGLLVRFYLESRVFIRKAFQGVAHFLLVGFGLGFYAKRNNRVGKLNCFKHDWVLLVTERM